MTDNELHKSIFAEVEDIIRRDRIWDINRWYCAPTSHADDIVKELLPVISRLLHGAQCPLTACRDEILWRKIIKKEKMAAHADALMAAASKANDYLGRNHDSEIARDILTLIPERAQLERELEVAKAIQAAVYTGSPGANQIKADRDVADLEAILAELSR